VWGSHEGISQEGTYLQRGHAFARERSNAVLVVGSRGPGMVQHPDGESVRRRSRTTPRPCSYYGAQRISGLWIGSTISARGTSHDARKAGASRRPPASSMVPGGLPVYSHPDLPGGSSWGGEVHQNWPEMRERDEKHEDWARSWVRCFCRPEIRLRRLPGQRARSLPEEVRDLRLAVAAGAGAGREWLMHQAGERLTKVAPPGDPGPCPQCQQTIGTGEAASLEIIRVGKESHGVTDQFNPTT